MFIERMNVIVFKIALIVIVITFLTSSCQSQSAANQNVEILNTVWETMNTQYFDSTFNGLNWQKHYEYYKPIIESCDTNDSLYYYLNQMLSKLGVSHLGVVPPEESETIGDPQLFLDGTAGIDVRYLKGEAIISSVDPNSAASEKNTKPGFILLEINGNTIEQIVQKRKSEPTPPFNERNITAMITQDIIRELYGTPGDPVNIRYLDADNIEQNVSILMRKRNIPKATLLPDVPAIYASVKNRVVNGEIGYIRFDVFHPVILDTLVKIINEYKQLSSLILDIRGNPGGDFNTRKTLAEQFASDRTLFWKYKSRNGIREVYLDPPPEPYTGNLVILVDELSGSSSEEFAGGMQAIGRVTIVGQQTPGKVLTMEVVPLPEGALFVYPNAQTLTAKDEVLEGVGVSPDIKVELDKETLLRGIDNQLEKAVKYLFNKNE